MFSDYPGHGPSNYGLAGICPSSPPEQFPISHAVTSYVVDMTTDSGPLPVGDWTFAFLLRPNSWLLCGEMGTGHRLRFTYPHDGVEMIGPTVSNRSLYTEYRLTIFEFKVDFSYAPLPTSPLPL
jgi:hypothetical protein